MRIFHDVTFDIQQHNITLPVHATEPLQVAVFSRTWRAPARHMFTWLESFNEKDMPTRPLHASPSIHSCEIIFGETTAEKCAN
jgi:hypothetical protein